MQVTQIQKLHVINGTTQCKLNVHEVLTYKCTSNYLLMKYRVTILNTNAYTSLFGTQVLTHHSWQCTTCESEIQPPSISQELDPDSKEIKASLNTYTPVHIQQKNQGGGCTWWVGHKFNIESTLIFNNSINQSTNYYIL